MDFFDLYNVELADKRTGKDKQDHPSSGVS